MAEQEKPIEEVMRALRERAKELACLYRVNELLNRQDSPTEDVLRELIETVPAGWQYPDCCQAKLTLNTTVYQPSGFSESPWVMKAPIVLEGEAIGQVEVYYTEEKPVADEGPFLKEERKLINNIAERIGYFLFQHRLGNDLRSWKASIQRESTRGKGEWRVIIDFLRQTDPNLLVRITRKMINYLCWHGVNEAKKMLREFAPPEGELEKQLSDENRPQPKRATADLVDIADRAFVIATEHLSEDEVVSRIHTWIKEDKAAFLIDTVARLDASLGEITNALERFKGISVDETELPLAVQTELKVSLLRRFLSDQIDFINVAKGYVEVGDFNELAKRVIGSPTSRGKLGGKATGLFLAFQIIRRSTEYTDLLGRIKVPRTRFLTSDTMLEFIHYNHLDDVYSRKYMEVSQVRQDYPNTVQVFKSSHFPPEIVSGLSAVLDELEDRPLIVRSSSLLEDRTGASFSGKYKSLFLANQGTKGSRLEALQDAIAEVYASIFNPDAIEYRSERGLLDVHEEMGIMIQEVVGTRIGKYFMPAFSGVAFSNNEFRWSPRVKREDGLLRLVPGLGTRAVDRLTDDYPVLIAAGQPNLRVNATPDEVIRYSPKNIDVLDLHANSFETVDVRDLLRECGQEYPLSRRIVSIVEHDQLRKPTGLGPDFDQDDLVVTFEGLVSETSFVAQMRALLTLLQERLGRPVDIEFASDGKNIHLLQCRPQSHREDAAPTPIPRNLPKDKILFSADRYIANGRIPNITHIVYVDADSYSNLTDLSEFRDVGRAVGKLNTLLPKRKFILMGPGRWGSRGDIKLGVAVSYSDINNTALLVEVARRKGNYVPELSFGTHFFQDLVEAGIRYLPLYPDEQGLLFNELFFLRSRNVLPVLLPEYAHLEDVVRVIDIPSEQPDQVCHVLMNAELDEAFGILAHPTEAEPKERASDATVAAMPEDHWRWRLGMAEKIASELDPSRFGVKGLYVFGGVKNAIAGPGSDIDLLVHFAGSESQRTGAHALVGRLESEFGGNQLPSYRIRDRGAPRRSSVDGQGYRQSDELRRQDRCRY